MNTYKNLIVIDVDGTLRNDDGIISDRNKEALDKVMKNGNLAVVCTGRPRHKSLHIAEEINSVDYIITLNGAEVFDMANQQTIYASSLDKEYIYEILEYCYEKDIRVALTTGTCDYVTKDVRSEIDILLPRDNYKEVLEDTTIIQCMFCDYRMDVMNELKEKVKKDDVLCIVNAQKGDVDPTRDYWFCIANKTVSKGNGLKFLAQHLKVPMENTIAIGNEKNDISMFEAASVGVAMGNANDYVKSYANFITKSNEEDGVAIYLENKLKNQEL